MAIRTSHESKSERREAQLTKADPGSRAAPDTAASSLSSRRGVAILLLLRLVQFMDVLDASILNIALPSIRRDLGFTQQSLQWVVSGYVLTYGGFLLLGGRAADLLGRRRVLVDRPGRVRGRLAARRPRPERGLLVGARLAQGIGAAMISPAALSTLTTTFRRPATAHRARRLGRRLRARRRRRRAARRRPHRGARLALGPVRQRPVQRRRARRRVRAPEAGARRPPAWRTSTRSGAVLVTGGMLLLVYALVKAPDVGWGTTRTIVELAAAALLLARFVANELRARNPLRPALDPARQGSRRRRRDPDDGLRRLPADVLLPHPLHAERARLLADPDRGWPTCR